MKNSRVGIDKDGTDLSVGDICKFKIKGKEYIGMIMYEEQEFSHVFDMLNDKFPCIFMNKVDEFSISKIISIYSTKVNDEWEGFRNIWSGLSKINNGDFGVECENCECLTCMNNDGCICKNCFNCSGNLGYNNWKMNCKKYDECENPEQTIKIVLGDI